MPIEYYCKKCQRTYTLIEYNENRFCRDCGSYLSPKVLNRPKQKNIGIKQEPIEIKKEDINVKTMFHEFITDRVQPYSSVPGMTVHSWIARRKDVYRKYQKLFQPNMLHNVEQVKKDYKDWLLFENNLSWTQLHRTGYYALEEPEKISDLLSMIQDDSIDIGKKIDRGLNGPEKIYGIGEGILTALLHTLYPEKYCVVNSRTRETLEILRRQPVDTYYAKTQGQKYKKINHSLGGLADELKTDLVYIDGFMWYVSSKYTFI